MRGWGNEERLRDAEASRGRVVLISPFPHSLIPSIDESRLLVNSYLESVLLGACPELREEWQVRRRSFGARESDDAELLDAVRRHVLGLLAAGRVAEFSRFARAIERLLGESDPVLYELLLDGLLRPLAADVHAARISPALVAPHLGTRTA